MNYTLNQLQIFLKIVKAQSITKASEELHLTQPAVSIQLKKFQSQFEIPLTEVVGRKIHITDFGKEIAKSVEDILNQVDAINYKSQAYKGQLTGKIKISVVSTGKYVMPYFISKFMQQNEGVELTMDVTNKSRVVESLKKNEVDFSLVSILPPTLKVDKLNLMQNKLFLVGNRPVQQDKKQGFPQTLNDLPLIFREKGSGTRQIMESFIENNNISARKKMELTSNEAVKQAVIAGLGFSIMPIIGIKNEIKNNDLQIIPINGLPIITTWSLIWPKGKMHSPAAKAILNYMKEEKENIVQQTFNWNERN